MGAISQKSLASWYNNGGNAWAAHSSMELTTSYGREGRVQFNTLSAGQPVTALSFRFNKTNSGGGGTFRLYATDNPNLLPADMYNAVYVGDLAGWGSGTGWKTCPMTQVMMDALSCFTGTWYLLMESSVYVTFYGGSGTNAPEFTGTHADGSLYINDGGVQKISTPWVNDGGIQKQCVAWVNVGGVWKQGIP